VLTVPWIAFGPDIKKGHVIEKNVSVLDTAPTLARLMDIHGHYAWEGSVVNEIIIDDVEDHPVIEENFPSSVSAVQ
jgi:hypothetical protein